MNGVFGPARGGTVRAIGPRLFFWPELRTRDAARARRFYAAVLGCDLKWLPGEATAIVRCEERVIGAITERSKNGRAPASADHWRLYLVKGSSAVEGAATGWTGAPARGHLIDAPGAQLAADQASAHFGGACSRGREAVLWFEPERADDRGSGGSEDSSLCAEEAVGRAALLEATVGEDHDTSDTAPGPRLFHNDVTNAGAGVLVGVTEPGGISVSNVCLTVDDCAGALRRVRAAGGTIVGRSTELATGGRVAAVIDPQGAAFFCWQPSTAEASRTLPRARALTAPVAGPRRSALDPRALSTSDPALGLRFLATQRRAR
jgi:predicted enzyme related to lactoylglutathione lyase